MLLIGGETVRLGLETGIEALDAVQVVSDQHLSIPEQLIFWDAFSLIADHAKKHQFPSHVAQSSLRCHILVLHSEKAALMFATGELGSFAPIIFLPMSRILSRKREAAAAFHRAVLLEELCHYLYEIWDEYEVKELVADILRRKYPTLRLHQIHPDWFDENDARIPGMPNPYGS